MLKITGGDLKGKSIECPPGKDIRPTSSKTRQGLFNVLFSMGVELRGARILELFAGTGLISFESISRGAGHATMVDKETSSLKVIEKNSVALSLNSNIKLVKQDVEAFLSQTDISSFDIIYLDPPYKYDGYQRVLKLLVTGIKKEAVVIAESDKELFSDANLYGAELLKVKKWGKSFAHFLKIKDDQ